MGNHSLLQGIFLTQGLNLGLMHCRQILYCLNHQRSPKANKKLEQFARDECLAWYKIWPLNLAWASLPRTSETQGRQGWPKKRLAPSFANLYFNLSIHISLGLKCHQLECSETYSKCKKKVSESLKSTRLFCLDKLTRGWLSFPWEE